MNGSISDSAVVVKDPWFVYDWQWWKRGVIRGCFGVSRERTCRVVSEAGVCRIGGSKSNLLSLSQCWVWGFEQDSSTVRKWLSKGSVCCNILKVKHFGL